MEREGKGGNVFLRKYSFSEMLLTNQSHIGASQPTAQLRRHRNIGRAVH